VDEEPVWQNPLPDAPLGVRWLTAIVIAGRYLGLVLVPWRLSVDYYSDVVPLVRSPLAPAFLFSAAALVAAGAASLAAARRWPAALYGLVTAVGGWLVVSHLFFAAPIVLAERALYLPMAGIAAIAGAAAIALAGRLPRRLLRAAALAALVLAGWRSFDRVRDWHDDRTLFAAATVATPRSALAWNNLGAVQQAAGELESARASFARAVEIAPRYLRARLNEARVCLAAGRAVEAERLLEAAAAEFPAQRDLVGLELVQVRERRAEALRAAGDGTAARDLFVAVVEQAGLAAETTDDPQAEAAFLLVAARAAAAAGRPDVAEGTFSRALAATVLAEDLVDLRRVILEELARFLLRTRRPRDAAETYRLAADSAIELGDAASAVRLHLQAAEAFRAAGDPAEADRSVTLAQRAAGDDAALRSLARAGTPE
jgi:tetratricopeptide (TPR) repeat protein